MPGIRISRRKALTGSLAAAVSCPVAACVEAVFASDRAATIRDIREAAEALPDLSDPAFGRHFDRFGSARVVLMGEATHGTSEFYRARAEGTKYLIQNHGFTIVAVEADWPDASHVDSYIRGRERPPAPRRPFRRFPTWMWRNAEIRALVDWLREYNSSIGEPGKQVGFHGLDIYGLAASTDNVVEHLGKPDPEAAAVARRHYACLAPYREDPTDYARDALRSGFGDCKEEVSAALKIVEGRLTPAGDPAAFEILQNARAALGGERYYRTMAGGAASSWNLRDQYMFDTLLQVLQARGPDAKAVVWAHNSHVGNAAATEMGRRGEHNIGQLCRQHFGNAATLIGFGTDRGTVMAARQWGGDPEVMEVRPSLPESYGALFREAGRGAFMLDLRPGAHDRLRQALRAERIDRAIGVMYLPRSERMSHYFEASLPDQFDAYLWFNETRAVTPVRDGDPTLGADHPLSG